MLSVCSVLANESVRLTCSTLSCLVERHSRHSRSTHDSTPVYELFTEIHAPGRQTDRVCTSVFSISSASHYPAQNVQSLPSLTPCIHLVSLPHGASFCTQFNLPQPHTPSSHLNLLLHCVKRTKAQFSLEKVYKVKLTSK